MRKYHKTTFFKKTLHIFMIYIFSPMSIVKSEPYDLDEDVELIAEKMVDDFNIPGIMEQDTTSKPTNRSNINVEENSTNSEIWLSCQHCDRKFRTKTGLNIHCGRKHTISKVPDAGENAESESDLDTVSKKFLQKVL